MGKSESTKESLNVVIDGDVKLSFQSEIIKKKLKMNTVTEALVRMYLDMNELERNKLLEKYS